MATINPNTAKKASQVLTQVAKSLPDQKAVYMTANTKGEAGKRSSIKLTKQNNQITAQITLDKKSETATFSIGEKGNVAFKDSSHAKVLEAVIKHVGPKKQVEIPAGPKTESTPADQSETNHNTTQANTKKPEPKSELKSKEKSEEIVAPGEYSAVRRVMSTAGELLTPHEQGVLDRAEPIVLT
jgi:hypothetical protein